MKNIIKELILKAESTNDKELANLASDLMERMAKTVNCPEDWRVIAKDLFDDFCDEAWVMENISLFANMEDAIERLVG